MPLKPGMILSNEPGFYKADAYGIRIENLLVVIERGIPQNGERPLLGFENLTRVPLDRRLIVTSMLDAEEYAWVDAYHAKVRHDLGDLLTARARTWMMAATEPLG